MLSTANSGDRAPVHTPFLPSSVSVAKSMGVGGARKQIRSQKPDEREISAFCLETTHRGVGTNFHLPGKKSDQNFRIPAPYQRTNNIE